LVDVPEVEVGGRRVAYERAGSGPTVVLLHGFAGDHREWRRQIDGLSDAFDLVAWDAPGAGGSEPLSDSSGMGDFADALARFIEVLGIDRPHVAGLSFGGALALELFRRHPGFARSLVLVSAYAGWRGSLGALTAADRLSAALAFADGTPAEFADAMLPSLLPPGTSERLREEYRTIAQDVQLAGFRTMARSLAEADLRDVLARIDRPCLLVYGDADARAPLTVAHDLHGAIRGSRLVILPGVGHVVTLQAGDALNAEIRAFLASQGP
jgi:pimeloyl-ACP methyl ester carboxylesterase